MSVSPQQEPLPPPSQSTPTVTDTLSPPIPNVPSPDVLSAQTHSQLAALLADACKEAEHLRRELAQTRKRAEKAERLVSALSSFTSSGQPSSASPSSSPNVNTTTATTNGTNTAANSPTTASHNPESARALLLEYEDRVGRAEQARDEAEARRRVIVDNWQQLERYLQGLEFHASDARSGFARIVADGGGPLVLTDLNALPSASRSLFSNSASSSIMGPPPTSTLSGKFYPAPSRNNSGGSTTSLTPRPATHFPLTSLPLPPHPSAGSRVRHRDGSIDNGDAMQPPSKKSRTIYSEPSNSPHLSNAQYVQQQGYATPTLHAISRKPDDIDPRGRDVTYIDQHGQPIPPPHEYHNPYPPPPHQSHHRSSRHHSSSQQIYHHSQARVIHDKYSSSHHPHHPHSHHHHSSRSRSLSRSHSRSPSAESENIDELLLATTGDEHQRGVNGVNGNAYPPHHGSNGAFGGPPERGGGQHQQPQQQQHTPHPPSSRIRYPMSTTSNRAARLAKMSQESPPPPPMHLSAGMLPLSRGYSPAPPPPQPQASSQHQPTLPPQLEYRTTRSSRSAGAAANNNNNNNNNGGGGGAGAGGAGGSAVTTVHAEPGPLSQPGQVQTYQTHVFAPVVTGAPVKKTKYAAGGAGSAGVVGGAPVTSQDPNAAGAPGVPGAAAAGGGGGGPPVSSFPATNAQGQRICRQCGLPGRYKEGKCVEKWGPGPQGPGTVCDRCRKKMKRVERRGTLESQQLAAQNANAAAAAAHNAAYAQAPQPLPPTSHARTVQHPPTRTDTLPQVSPTPSYTLRPDREDSSANLRSAIANSHTSSSSRRQTGPQPPSPPSIATLPEDAPPLSGSRTASRSNSRSRRPRAADGPLPPPPSSASLRRGGDEVNGARKIGKMVPTSAMRMEVDGESPTGGSGAEGDGDVDAEAEADAEMDGDAEGEGEGEGDGDVDVDEGDTLRELAEAAGVSDIRSSSGGGGSRDRDRERSRVVAAVDADAEDDDDGGGDEVDADAEAEADADADLLEAVDAAEAAEANSSGGSSSGGWMKSET